MMTMTIMMAMMAMMKMMMMMAANDGTLLWWRLDSLDSWYRKIRMLMTSLSKMALTFIWEEAHFHVCECIKQRVFFYLYTSIYGMVFAGEIVLNMTGIAPCRSARHGSGTLASASCRATRLRLMIWPPRTIAYGWIWCWDWNSNGWVSWMDI